MLRIPLKPLKPKRPGTQGTPCPELRCRRRDLAISVALNLSARLLTHSRGSVGTYAGLDWIADIFYVTTVLIYRQAEFRTEPGQMSYLPENPALGGTEKKVQNGPISSR